MVSLLFILVYADVAEAEESIRLAEASKKGVVQVNVVYIDDENVKHILCGGTGFIVGKKEGTEYVVTNNHIVNLDDEVKEEAFNYWGIENPSETWSKLPLQTEIVIEGDMVVEASIKSVSEDYDLAVLQLPQPIYTKEPLTILTEENYDSEKLPYKTSDSVYALGYPNEIRYDSEKQYYADQQIAMMTGHIVNLTNIEGIQVVESDATVGANNCGGPLVEENGYVVGMNILLKDGMYSCALDSTKIAKMLDGLGIEYSCEYSRPVKEEPVKDGDSKKGREMPIWLLIIICVAIVSVVAGVVTIIIVKTVHKKAEKEAEEPEVKNEALARYIDQPKEDENNLGTGISSVEGSGLPDTETGNDDLANAFAEKYIIGTLERVNTGEEIKINKSYFTIGKDILHVDYCIKDNGSISKEHAIIRQSREGVYLEDNNSEKGTWLNGNRVVFGRAELLRNGDLIGVSNEEFVFRS